MAGNMTEAAKHIRENIARVKGYTRRDESLRALDMLADTLIAYTEQKFMGNVRFELEVNLDEALSEVGRMPAVRPMLPATNTSKPFVLRYIKGKEKVLAAALQSFAARIRSSAEDAERERLERIEEHRKQLLRAGQEYLNRGDHVRARVFLGRCASEFGKNPGVLADIAKQFKDKELFLEAAEMYQRAAEMFPREASNYVRLIECYMALQEYASVEKIYQQVIRQFGVHPRTLYNMARFYLVWRKKDHAAEAAYRALKADPNFAEARELLNRLDGRQ